MQEAQGYKILKLEKIYDQPEDVKMKISATIAMICGTASYLYSGVVQGNDVLDQIMYFMLMYGGFYTLEVLKGINDKTNFDISKLPQGIIDKLNQAEGKARGSK